MVKKKHEIIVNIVCRYKELFSMKIRLYLSIFVLILSFISFITAKQNDAGQFLVRKKKRI